VSPEEIKAIVRETLAEMFGVAPQTQDRWVSLQDAVDPLGYPSYDALYKGVTSGVFRVGKELRDRRKPGSRRPIYQINLALAEKRLSEDQSKRRAV
jgi:hypothetical protein